MRLRLFIIGILLVALAISFPLLSAAQGTAEVQIGQPIAGRLTPDQLEIRYAYEGQVGEQLSIAVEATFDSYVELQDDTWQRLMTPGSGLPAMMMRRKVPVRSSTLH